MARPGRWLDLGALKPLALHAAYAGVAQAMGDESAPVLIWARADRPHVSLGASQSAAAELDLGACRAAGVELVARPLGGGTVLIDPAQYGLFLVVPRRRLADRHAALFAACLPAMAAVLGDFGLQAQPVGATDVWVGGRKLVGSGAATIGRALVFGASFLVRFEAELFARLVHCPSAGFRRWLAEALAEGLTGWAEQGEAPGETELAAAVRRRFASALACDWQDAPLSAAEHAALEQARAELIEERQALLEGAIGGARRLVANGIKVNHRSYLVEQGGEDEPGGWLRLWLREGRIARIACADAELSDGLQVCVGMPAEGQALRGPLASALRGGADEYWAGRIERLAADVRRVSRE